MSDKQSIWADLYSDPVITEAASATLLPNDESLHGESFVSQKNDPADVIHNFGNVSRRGFGFNPVSNSEFDLYLSIIDKNREPE